MRKVPLPVPLRRGQVVGFSDEVSLCTLGARPAPELGSSGHSDLETATFGHEPSDNV